MREEIRRKMRKTNKTNKHHKYYHPCTEEISKLKAKHHKREEEWESQMSKQIGNYKAQCYNMEKQVSTAKSNLVDAKSCMRELKDLLDAKDHYLHDKKCRLC